LRKRTGLPVLLADLAAGGGSVAFLMRAESPYTLVDLAERAHLLDAATWKQIVKPGYGGVDVILAPEGSGQAPAPSPSRLRHVLHSARALYPWIVLDLGQVCTCPRELLAAVDELLLLTTPDVISVFHAKRTLGTVPPQEGEGPPAKIVVNCAGQAALLHGAGWEELFGVVPWAVVPAEAGALLDAYTKGRLLDSSGGFSESLLSMAARLAGLEEARPDRGGWLKMIGWPRGRQRVEALQNE